MSKITNDYLTRSGTDAL